MELVVCLHIKQKAVKFPIINTKGNVELPKVAAKTTVSPNQVLLTERLWVAGLLLT